jgi:hypothetical protein
MMISTFLVYRCVFTRNRCIVLTSFSGHRQYTRSPFFRINVVGSGKLGSSLSAAAAAAGGRFFPVRAVVVAVVVALLRSQGRFKQAPLDPCPPNLTLSRHLP